MNNTSMEAWSYVQYQVVSEMSAEKDYVPFTEAASDANCQNVVFHVGFEVIVHSTRIK